MIDLACRAALALGLASLIAVAGCPSGPPPAPDPKPPDVTDPHPGLPDAPAPLTRGGGDVRPKLEHHTLANGLEVYLLPDAGAPLVNVQWWVRAGSGNEHEAGPHEDHGITGLSHFFEHLMFQGTARFPNYDDALTPLGAQNNAFTYQDATVFWAYTPKQHLRLILDIEADRFEHMKVDFVHVETEREVVKSERRERTDSDPAEVAEERAIRSMYDHASYRWGPIGWMTDLDAITLEEAQAYHTAHYHVGRTFMVIAGDFDPAETMRWIEELWGPLVKRSSAPSPGAPAPTRGAAETWVGPRTDHVYAETPNATVIWTYRSPPPGGATLRDYAALELIDVILTAGKAGRLQKSLVYGDAPKLSRLGASLFPMRDAYVYKWRADLLDGVSVGSVEAAIDEAMTALASSGVSADELARAVASLRTDTVQEHLSNSSRAESVGFALAATDAPFALFDRLAAYATITSADIEAVATRWLKPEARARVVVIAPSRYVALAKAWETPGVTPPSPLDGSVSAAAEWFADDRALAVRRADLEREQRAVALLAQRADVAKKTAGKDEKQAIDKFLSENESGTVKRRARLAAELKAIDAEAFALSTRKKKLLAQVEALVRKSEVAVQGPKLAAFRVLLSGPDELAFPVPPAGAEPGFAGASALALEVLASWVAEARGLAKTAQDARAWVMTAAAKWHGADVPEVVRRAMDLAHDLSIEGLPVSDVPLHAVRPTQEGR